MKQISSSQDKNEDALPIADVILLGAGASKSEGAPLQKELFKSFFDYIRVNPSWHSKDYAKEVTTIKDFFYNFWGIRINDTSLNDEDFPTFEECLGVLDTALARNQSFRDNDKQAIRNIRNSLVFLIAKILDEKLGPGQFHRRLIDRLHNQSRLRQTAFISLNYDILIDNALIAQYPEHHLDYRIEFVNYEREYDFLKPDPDRAVSLIKIHGSLNWLYCPTCGALERKEHKATTAFYKPEPCSDCHTYMEPIIIPPSFYKEFSNPFTQQILYAADLAFRRANRVFICGYSFPDADLHVKYLLKRAEQYQGKTPEIIVIDIDRSNDFKNRFRRFFKDYRHVTFPEANFEIFCNEGVE